MSVFRCMCYDFLCIVRWWKGDQYPMNRRFWMQSNGKHLEFQALIFCFRCFSFCSISFQWEFNEKSWELWVQSMISERPWMPMDKIVVPLSPFAGALEISHGLVVGTHNENNGGCFQHSNDWKWYRRGVVHNAFRSTAMLCF